MKGWLNNLKLNNFCLQKSRPQNLEINKNYRFNTLQHRSNKTKQNCNFKKKKEIEGV